MLGLSLSEIIFLAILALVVVGPKQLPEVARTLGRMLNELRRASSSITDELREHVKVDSIRIDDTKPPAEPQMKPHKPNEGGNYHVDEPLPNGKSEDSEVKKS
jgi:sec-independent protein translocase protein TatB